MLSSDQGINPFSTETVLLVGYWSPFTYTLSFSNRTPVSVPILSVNWAYQLTGYKLCPMKWSNTGNVQKIDDLMYLNVRRLQQVLGIQSMFLSTTIVVASIEWVKTCKITYEVTSLCYGINVQNYQQNLWFIS